MGLGASTAPLVEQDDVIVLGVKKAVVVGPATGTWTAVKE